MSGLSCQFELFAPPPPPPPAADMLAARILEAGLERSEWLLNNNRALGCWQIGNDLPYPWSLPSRAFKFPIEFRGGQGKGDGWISLRHPLLADHPYVIEVGERLGEPVPWRKVDEFGRPLEANTQWFHAIDLMTEAHWRDLLDTAQFTDPKSLLRAVALALQFPAGYEGKGKKSGQISIATARTVLDWLGCVEPEDRSRAALMSEKLRPSPIVERNGKGVVTLTRWPLNLHLDCAEDEAWAMIHGLEDGLFVRTRSGFVEWSEKGRAQFPEEAVVEPEVEAA